MFKITLRVTARCPQHPRYNPELDGLAFRSICAGCQRAHSIYMKVMELRHYLGANDEAIPPTVVTKPTITKVKSAASGTLHIINSSAKFSGQRAAVWALVQEGMPVQALYDQAAAAGLNGKGVLAKIIAMKCVEVKL